jgi:hypothetical protein
MMLGVLAGMLDCAGSANKPDAPAGPVPLDESALMASLRASVKPEPAKAVALADEGERRFAESPLAEERRALAIRALINLQRIGVARSQAYGFLERYPNGPYSAEIAAMTGVHVTPRGPSQGGP